MIRKTDSSGEMMGTNEITPKRDVIWETRCVQPLVGPGSAVPV